jgi:predicted transcriptional regulator
MLPPELLIRTRVARAGMKVREIFEECLRARLQSMPYCDDRDVVIGRVTLKHIINRSIVPEYMAELAPVLGSDMVAFGEMEETTRKVLDDPVEPYVQEPHAAIDSTTPLMKALAVMEHYDTSYLFVVDDDRYQGTLTVPGIAAWMMRIDEG